MKWLKTIKARWLIPIIIIIQLGIWLPSLITEAPEPEFQAQALKSVPVRMEANVPDDSIPYLEVQIENLEGMAQNTTDEKVLILIEKRIEVLEFEIISLERYQPEHAPTSIASDEPTPTLNLNQPTVLIYADWFLINWQALLSILTMLPIVFVRWKNLLSGKPIAAEVPEVK